MHVDVSTFFTVLSLTVCVYCRTGHWRRYKQFPSDWPWVRKRDPQLMPQLEVDVQECCPSVTEVIQPAGGVSRTGRIMELYRDRNRTQSFYHTSCASGVKGKPCKFVRPLFRMHSRCVQRYGYTYALVRDLNSDLQWRLDYIRVRSGCTCEVRRPRAKSRHPDF